MSSTSALKMPTSVRSVSSSPRPTSWRPVKTVSAPFTVDRVRRERDRVLAHRARDRTPDGAPARLAESPGGWRAQNSRNSLRVRSRPVVLSAVTIERHRGAKSPPRLRPARGVVALDDAARGVGVQRQVEHVLGLLPAARQPDERVDILRPDLDRPSIGGADRHQALPDQLAPRRRGRSRGEADVLQAHGLLRRAAELPLRLAHGNLQPGLRLELLEVRLARAVRVRLAEGDLGVDVEDARARSSGWR